MVLGKSKSLIAIYVLMLLGILLGIFSLLDSGSINSRLSKNIPLEVDISFNNSSAAEPLIIPETELEILTLEHFSIDFDDPELHFLYLRNLSNYDRLIRIRYLLSEAIDQGEDLSKLQVFGLDKKEDGSYSIDLVSNPGWLTLDEIFFELRNQNTFNESIKPMLPGFGFNSTEIGQLDELISNNDLELETFKSMLSTINQHIERARENQLNVNDRERARHLSIEMNRQLNLEYFHIVKQWTLNLIDRLDEASQFKLFQLFNQRKQSISFFSSSLEELTDRFILDFETESYKTILQDRISQLENK